MNKPEQTNQPSPQENVIGDQNVERLLTTAYQPEALDPEFVRRVHARAGEAAKEGRRRTATSPASSNDAWSKPRLWLAAGCISLAVVFAAGYFVANKGPRKTDYYPDGTLVWINGQAYVPAGSGAPDGGNDPVLKPLPVTTHAVSREDSELLRIGEQGLTPRRRPAETPSEIVSIGDSIITRRGERRRVELPDKSILYVNESASLRIDAARRITVETGEVFVEVSPAEANGGNKFVVQTPARDVTAVGTKFAINVKAEGTDVAVTQGKVQVTGIQQMLLAGQQFRADDISPLPRTSHVLDWTRELMTAAESPLVPASEYGGGALVAIDPHGQQTKLSLRKYHVDVHIEDGSARTTIDQTYFNHQSGRLEGTFYFPLPPDASISRLAMYVNGRLMEGGMAEREHARNVFETIKYRSLDPALLEWVDGSTFKMRVFPLEGRQEKRIILSYTQRLDNNYGSTQYRFPVGHNMDVVRDWSVKLHVAQGAVLRWECTSHDLIADTQEGHLTLTASDHNAKPDRDIVVGLFDEGERGDPLSERSRFSTVEHDGSHYLMLRFRPELETAKQRERRDWVFLLEADGSRDPLLARAQVDIVKTLLQNAEHDDTFSIVTAGTRVHAFAASQQPATPDNIAAAVAFLDKMHLVGALNLEQAIAAAGNYMQAADRPVLVHVGAGIPILGELEIGKLVEMLSKDAPYVGVGVGKRWNRQFMRAAASRTGGYFTQINPDESINWRAFELVSSLNTPRLSDIRVVADDGQVDFLVMKDWVSHGEEICAVARLQLGQTGVESVTVSGSVGGQPYQRTISAGKVEERAEYLPRMWAKLAIDEMVARDAEQNKSRIIELSKSMYVMSPFTSLLVLENDEMYEQYNVDRGRKDHWALYPCPDKIEVVHEPLHGPPPAVTSEPSGEPAKPSLEQVLQTLLVRTSDFGYGTLATVNRLPTFSFTTVSTTVSVPDGGTVLLGGIRRLQEARSERGIPMLSNVPYVNRLFKNGRYDGTANTLMLMVTPRIIIQEEEEERLGIEIVDDSNGRVFRNPRYGNGDAALADFDSLIELITNTIAPETWDDVGGPGVSDPFPTNLSLVISQTQQVHDQTIRGYDRLRSRVYPVGDLVIPITQAHSSGFGTVLLTDGVDAELPILYPDAQIWQELTRRRKQYASVDLAGKLGMSEERILAELDKKTEFKFRERPLKDVIEDIANRHNLPIVINSAAIEDYGIALDTPITFKTQGRKLKSALSRMLDELDLTYFIADDVLQITTPVDSQLVSRLYWSDEMLLLVRRDGSAGQVDVGHDAPARLPILDDPRLVDRWAEILTQRLSQGAEQPSLLYLRPQSFGNRRTFRHLVSFAPAITTTKADALAVLEEEAELKNPPKIGTVDERARELIEAGRGRGWQLVTLRDQGNRVVLELAIDGQGRFRFDHRTEHGLGETAVCDGETLRHLYPELGLGTTRRMSRFHRADLARLVPWLLPPVDDLAMGADLRLVGPSTVAIAPHRFDEAKDSEGQPQTYVRLHLVFAADGRLAERRVVEMPSGKTILRVAYAADGTVRWFDGDDQQQGEFQIAVEKTSAPDLKPAVDELVLLPMPVRERAHVYEIAKQAALNSATSSEKTDALQAIANRDRTQADDPADWNEEDALRLLAASHWQDSSELQDVIGRRFFARGDRRLGFYTLLLSSGERWKIDQRVQLGDGTTTRMEPLADHPNSPLARYIDSQMRNAKLDARESGSPGEEPQHDFITQLAEYESLCTRWSLANDPPGNAEVRRQELDELFGFIQRCDSTTFAFTLLRRLQRRYEDSQPHGRIAEALIALEKHGTISYVVKYELARSLASAGDKEQARNLFVQLHREVLDEGILPPIDETFRAAFRNSVPDRDDPFADPFGSDESAAQVFTGLMRGACARLIERKQRPLAIGLAWQCRQLDAAELGDTLIDRVLTGVPDDEQLGTTLAALEYLLRTGKHDRADALLKPLLSRQPYSESSALWRLAAGVAGDGGRLARAVSHLERAMDLEYANLPKRYDVEQVRERYGQLFASYHELAAIVATPDADAPLNLAGRAIKAADRWRSLDSDVTAACNNAARLLNELGQEDLAWDYLTTPLAMKPNEAAAWLTLAETLRNDGELEMADRAYASAFQAEPTNAQILWDHAQLLERAGRGNEARTLYLQISEGEWQPRFNQIKWQAERIVARDFN